MELLFLKVFNISIMAGIAVLFVCILRTMLHRSPKRFTCLLWVIVFLRFLCPVNLSSGFSLIPEINVLSVQEKELYQMNEAKPTQSEGQAVSQTMGRETNTGEGKRADVAQSVDVYDLSSSSYIADHSPKTDGVFWDTSNKNSKLQANQTVKGIPDIIVQGMAFVWIAGVFVLAAVLLIQSIILEKKLKTAVLVSPGNGKLCPIYETDNITTPFLYGIIRPVIYMPLDVGEERAFIITHEQMHKKYLDHIIKPICLLAVIIHWFNPLAWISFLLFARDVEMSCDEEVLKTAGADIRQKYSKGLLQMSVSNLGFTIPLAFGESNISQRIKHILNYKKPSTWAAVAAIVVILTASVTLLTNSEQKINPKQQDISLETQLCEYRNPNIGDNSADGRLISLMPIPQGYEWNGMELKTAEEPFELVLRWKKSKESNSSLDISEVLFSNAAYLFATIENMEICTVELPVLNGEGTYFASYCRTDMEAIFGPLYQRSESLDELQKLTVEIKEYYNKDYPEYKIHAENFSPVESYTLDKGGDPKADFKEFLNLVVLGKTEKYHVMIGSTAHAQGMVVFGGEQQVLKRLEQSDEEVTVYLSALVAFYQEGTTDIVYHVQTPAAITLVYGDDGIYHLKEYWEPKKGSEYESSIKEKFPEEYWEDALDTTKYTMVQKQKIWPML